MKKAPKATLFVHFHEATDQEIREEFSEFDADEPCPVCNEIHDDITDHVGGLKVSFSYREHDGVLTEDDFNPETPEKCLKDGIMLAIAEQVMVGLASARGINFEEAATKAVDKMSEAASLVKRRQGVSEALNLVLDAFPQSMLDTLPDDLKKKVAETRALRSVPCEDEETDLRHCETEGNC
jgi:predicted DNA-binding protein (UPF0251 family)